ncbi:MAG: RNA polymerase factor sigma-54 [Puniceicoccales bacterium]|jgi:RNA polymerase sigma-54 factor|nr:RNA polymerase factor sigma-54 [Puniceicoccales bacterium]
MSSLAQGLQQSQHQAQKIILTPQLRQSLRILQIPTSELRQEINNSLTTNPLLEELAPAEPDIPTVPAPTAADATPACADASGDSTDADADASTAPMRQARLDTPMPDDDYNEILQKIRDDHEDGFRDDTAITSATSATPEEQEKFRQHIFDTAPQGAPSLETHLLAQARELAPNAPVLAALETLVGELDPHGFVTASLGDIALQTGHALSTLNTALRLLQGFDPPGIGAASIRECLLIQLRQSQGQNRNPAPDNDLGKSFNLAIAILEKSYPLLLKRRIPDIAAAHRVPISTVHDAFAILGKLETNPARPFERDENRIIAPEITFQRNATDDAWEAIVHNEILPRLRLNPEYKSRLGDKNLREGDREYISEKIREGRFLIGAVEQRQQTLAKIARLILQYQPDYFEHGPRKLRPLTMAQFAKELGVHETTVSRAIANKSASTPYGVKELRYFFPSGFTSESGENLANSSVRTLLEKIIANEPHDAPLSDEALSRELKKRGFTVARRTIAKYRDALNLPPAHLRKRLE